MKKHNFYLFSHKGIKYCLIHPLYPSKELRFNCLYDINEFYSEKT
jgi:hypothetical protein